LLIGPTDPCAIIDAAVRRRRPDTDASLRDLVAGHGAISDVERRAVVADWGNE